jgi:hypothetical protein
MRILALALTALLTLTAIADTHGTTRENERNFPNANTITLAPVNGNSYPGEALFERKPNGVTVLVKARGVNDRRQTVEIDRGACGKPATMERILKPLVDGSSTTFVPGVHAESWQDGKHSLRVKDPATHGGVSLCGTIVKPGFFTR